MNVVKKNMPGILACLVIALPAWFFGDCFSNHRRSGIWHPLRDTHRALLAAKKKQSSAAFYIKENSSIFDYPAGI